MQYLASFLFILLFLACNQPKNNDNPFIDCYSSKTDLNKKAVNELTLAYENYLIENGFLQNNQGYISIFKEISEHGTVLNKNFNLIPFQKFLKADEQMYTACIKDFYNSEEYLISKLNINNFQIGIDATKNGNNAIEAKKAAKIILNNLIAEDFDNILYKLDFFFRIELILKPSNENQIFSNEILLKSDSNGNLFFNDVQLSEDSLMYFVKNEANKNKETTIFINVDRRIKFKDFQKLSTKLSEIKDTINKINNSKLEIIINTD